MGFIQRILSLVFPENCLSCGKNDTVLCLPCARTLPTGFAPDKNTVVILDYGDRRTRKAVWLFKYRNKRGLSSVFAELVYDSLLEEMSEEKLMQNFSNPLLVPVPISKKRFRDRGYNQAELIAKELSALFGNSLSLCSGALKKIRHTESQVKTRNKKDRLKNLRGSFLADENLVHGKNIILLDDVITTGATVSEARRALKEAGAKKILVVALAH